LKKADKHETERERSSKGDRNKRKKGGLVQKKRGQKKAGKKRNAGVHSDKISGKRIQEKTKKKKKNIIGRTNGTTIRKTARPEKKCRGGSLKKRTSNFTRTQDWRGGKKKKGNQVVGTRKGGNQ